MRSVNVSDDALLPSEGEQLWQPGVSLAVAQKDSALYVYLEVAYAILWTFPGETLRTEKYTVNYMSRRHLKAKTVMLIVKVVSLIQPNCFQE